MAAPAPKAGDLLRGRDATARQAPVEPAAALAQRRFMHVSPARVLIGALIAAGVVALALLVGNSGTDGDPLIGPAAAKPLSSLANAPPCSAAACAVCGSRGRRCGAPAGSAGRRWRRPGP